MTVRLALLATVLGCGRLGFDDASITSPDGPVPACTVAACPAGFLVRAGGCYRVDLSPLPWLEAEAECEKVGAHLVVSDTIEEHFTIHDELAVDIERVWIGWSDRRTEQVFDWVAPSAGGLLQDNVCVFGAGEPDLGDGDHCVAQMGTNSCGDHFDMDCALALPYICECDGNLADPSRF
jgi:hypothetical protein